MGRCVSEFSETLGLGLEIQDLGCQDRVLVLVLTEFLNQDQSWYWSRLKFYFKTSLGLGLVWNLVSRQVLVLVSRGKKIKTKSIPNRIIMRNQKMDFPPGWLVVKLMIMTFFVNSYMFFSKRKYCHLCNRYFCNISISEWAFPYWNKGNKFANTDSILLSFCWLNIMDEMKTANHKIQYSF